uniref:Uncharacterized protein n=1 Tax=Rhizophora mucronata TaxID=61149 RepID=A0A2P2ILH6_RHIMU
MQVCVSQLEEYKHSKVALQEKVLRLVGDLTAREALSAVDSELKNELARAKIANNEFQRKIRHLEEENQEYQRRSRAFEEELKQHNEEKHDGHKSSFSTFSICPETNTTSSSTSHESNLAKVIAKPICGTGNSPDGEIEPFLKIQLLESELAEALEANDLYKSQLKSLLSQGRKDHSSVPRNLMDEDKLHKGDEDLHQASLLEELKDLREQYLHMSLKYAEVEAEREQLVLKLKSVGNGRRSFV